MSQEGIYAGGTVARQHPGIWQSKCRRLVCYVVRSRTAKGRNSASIRWSGRHVVEDAAAARTSLVMRKKLELAQVPANNIEAICTCVYHARACSTN